MLNRIKIGIKLTLGFVLILLLLVIVACAGYYALESSQRSTKKTTQVQDDRADVLSIRVNINRAMLAAAKGALYRDLKYEDERKELDDEIKKIADALETTLTDENKENLKGVMKAYDEFVGEDFKYYRAEEDFSKGEETLVNAGRVSAAALQKCIDLFGEAINASKTTNETNKDVVYVDNRFVRQVEKLQELLIKLGDLRRGYYRMTSQTTFEKQKAEGESLQKAAVELRSALGEFLTTVIDPNRQNEVKTAISEVEKWIADLQKNMENLAIQSKATEKQDELYLTIRKFLISMVDTSNTQLGNITKEMNKSDARVRLIMVTATIIAVIAGLFFSLVLSRNIGSGIKAVVEEIRHIASTGDLSEELPSAHYLARKDEVGDLAYSIKMVLEEFRGVANMAKELSDGNWQSNVKERGELDAMNRDLNSMLTQVNHVLHEIDESVKQVATGSSEVSSASQALSNGAQESAASLEEITASMSEISSQTKANAESAGQARDLAQTASKAATEGQSAMNDMTSAMDRITKNANEIQRVIKVIDDIAFQTNLLALNAAVEAARAGQHGKGFAVVAEEVRNLASRSAKAAQETSELIAKSGQEIEKGGEMTTHTANVLNTIVEQIKRTTDLVAGIAVASNEQAQGVNQVTIGLQQIDAVTQQNTAAAEESASAASEMSAMAGNLQRLVAQFKLRGHSGSKLAAAHKSAPVVHKPVAAPKPAATVTKPAPHMTRPSEQVTDDNWGGGKSTNIQIDLDDKNFGKY